MLAALRQQRQPRSELCALDLLVRLYVRVFADALMGLGNYAALLPLLLNFASCKWQLVCRFKPQPTCR